MMTRLTKFDREGIATRMLRHRFGAEYDALVADRAKFARSVYDDIYNKKARALMATLPAGWLSKENDIAASFGGTYENILFSGGVYGSINKLSSEKREKKDSTLPVPAKDKHGAVKVYDAGHPLSIEFGKLNARLADLKERVSIAEKQATAALANVSTVQQLLKLWPEAAPFCAHLTTSTFKPPALPAAQLNKLLDLPIAA